MAASLLGCGNGRQKLDNYGEGSSSMELPELTNEEEINEEGKISVVNESVNYEITIDEIAFTDKRNEYEAEYEDVVLVTYTYENHGEDILLIDDVRFQLISADGTKLYNPYYLADAMYAEPAGSQESKTAQIAFGVDDGQDSFKLVYKDTSSSEDAPWTLDIVLQKY